MKRILCIVESDALRVELDAASSAMTDGCEFLFSGDLASGLAMLRHQPVDVIAVELPTDAQKVVHWGQLTDSSTIPCPMIGILGDEAEQAEGVVVEAVRFGLRDFLRRPASAGELSGILARLSQPTQVSSRRGQIIAVASTKGGVGKSTIATNLAVGIARQFPQRVLLIDASLQLGVTASLLDLQPTTTISDVAVSVDRLDSTLLREMAIQHETGLDVIPAPVSPTEAADVDEAVMSVLLGVAQNTYDYILVDTFPLMDALMLSVFDRSDQIMIVTENVVPTLSGTAAMLRVLDQLQIPRERRMVILNRYRKLAGSLSPDDVSRQLNTPIEHVVPYDSRVIEAANLGKPLILGSKWRRSTSAMQKLTKSMLGRLRQLTIGTTPTQQSDQPAILAESPSGNPVSQVNVNQGSNRDVAENFNS